MGNILQDKLIKLGAKYSPGVASFWLQAHGNWRDLNK